MKFLNHNLFTGDITVNGTTTLSTATGITRPTGDNTTHLATTEFVKAQGYATTAALSGYVPITRTITINGTTLDLSADRTWTIASGDYTSKVQHQVKAGVAINKGQAVYVTTSDGTNMIVGLASNATEATSSKTMGLLDATVAQNGFANVVTEGLLAGLNTVGATAGDPVWLGTGGNLIYGLLNKPYAPAHLVFIGIVTRVNANNGEIFVKVQNGFELNEIHDIDLKTVVPVNGHILGFDGTLWVNKTIATWLGYTPANASGTTNYLSKFTGATTLGDSIIYDDGTKVGINTSTVEGGLHINYSAANTLLMQRISPDSGPPEAIGRKARGTVSAKTGVLSGDRLWFFAAAGYYGTEGVDGAWSANKVGMNFVASETWTPSAQGTHITWATTAAGQTTRTDKMILTGTGDLGIGTAAPASKLHAVGSSTTELRLQNSDANNNYGYIKYDTTVASTGGNLIIGTNTSGANYGAILFSSNNNVQFNGTGDIQIIKSGNVGIGTASPAYKLQVAGGDIAIDENNYLRGGYTGAWNLLKLYNGATGDMEITMLNTSWYLRHNANATFAGNVGIGTTSPGGKLTVIGTISQNATLQSSNTWANLILDSSASANADTNVVYANAGNLVWDIYNDGSTNALSINTKTISGAGIVATFLQNGNVGIGNTSPTAKLQVGAEAHPNATGIEVAAGTGGANLLAIDNANNHNWFPYTDGKNYYSATAHTFRNATHNVDWMHINSAGNVGIGTTNPTSTLQINGLQTNTTSTSANDPYGTLRLDYAGGYNAGDYGSSLVFTQQWFNGSSGQVAVGTISGVKEAGDGNFGGGLAFWTSNGSSNYLAERIRITKDGNVGIGTTSPASKLHIYQSNSEGIYLDGLQEYTTFKMLYGGNQKAEMVYQYSNDQLYFNKFGTGSFAFYGGNVGIGVTPTNKLQVANGNMSISTGYSFILADTDTNWRLGRNIIVENGNQLTANTMQFVAANAANEGWQFVDDDGNTRFEIGASTGNAWLPSGNLYLNSNLAWHAGNDGSGSGLDADLLDGVQLDNVVWGNARGTNQQLTNNNNDLDKTGYYTSDGFVTRPSGVANWMYIEHIKLYNDNTQYQKQIGYDTYDDRMWVRTKNAGTWSSWKQIWTSDSLTNLNQLTNGPGYITGYTETDTLATVTGRGASTSTAVSLSGGATIAGITNNGNLVNNGKIIVQNYTNGSNARGIFMWADADSNWGIYMSTAASGVSLAGGNAVSSIDGRTSHHIRFRVHNASGNGFIWENSSEVALMSLGGDNGNLYTRGQIYAGNSTSNVVWHAGNDGSGSGLDADLLDGLQASVFVRNDIYNSADAGLQVFRNIGTIDGSWPSSDHTFGLENSDAGNIVINFHRGGYTSNNLRYNGSQFRFDAALESTGIITASGGNSSQWNTAYSWGNHASQGYATQTYVNTAIANLVDAAPSTLDTLNELAAALGDDPNFATTVATSIGNKVAKAGDTMTGNLNWGATGLGLTWDMNTDGAYIKFFNTGNGDTDSRLEYGTYDDGNEYHRWVISSVERMNLKAAGLTVTGNVTCTGTFTETSSRRFKENIVDLESTAEKVEKLRPVRYNKIDNEATEIGLIAEEVAELFPEVVTYNENGQPSGVQYQRLSVILLKTVQELTERINKLENK